LFESRIFNPYNLFMKKTFFLFLIAIGFYFSGFAQKAGSSAQDKPGLADEIKTTLIVELKVSEDKAGRIMVIEDEFYNKQASFNTLNLSAIRKKEKLREAHLERRAKLVAVPLAPRQIEDAMQIVEKIRRKSGLQ
jgi:hypothetical protein